MNSGSDDEFSDLEQEDEEGITSTYSVMQYPYHTIHDLHKGHTMAVQRMFGVAVFYWYK